jgi:hypothetical protein
LAGIVLVAMSACQATKTIANSAILAQALLLMNSRSRYSVVQRTILLFFLLSVVLLTNGVCQQTDESAQTGSSKIQSSGAAKNRKTERAEPPEPAEAQESPSTEKKISPQEAEQLFRSVDQILKFASDESALPIHTTVKRRLTSRDEVTSYLEKHMAEDEDAQRLKRSELVLKKFGLLPRDFDLQKFLIALLREQVAGYYDPKTKTVNLLDWIDVEQQRPVLAHELTHALQDQTFGLEKWMKAGASDLALQKKNPTPAEVEEDEVQTARQAVVEGQAMVVLIDYMLAPTGQSILSSPQIAEALKQGMLVGTADSIQFRNAPIFMKEILTFPYRYGLDFVTDVLMAKGKKDAFAGIFNNPPRSTREIMEPKTYLAGERVPPLPVPDFAHLTKNYQKFDVGAMGEFDVALLVDQYAGVDQSKEMYPEWRGGYYYAAKPKGDPSAALALLYVSRWSTPEAAADFASIYASSLKRRYHSMRLIQAPKDGNGDAPRIGSHQWLTEDGDVNIDTQDDMVFITESFDDLTSAKLRDAVLSKAKSAATGK